MIVPVLSMVLLLGQASPTSPAAMSSAMVVTGSAIATDASTAPATSQPTKKSMVESIEKSKLGQVFSGERPLTLDDVKSPVFWFDTAKDFIITILAFIPRFIGTMVFLFVFWLVYRGIRKLAVSSMKKSEVDSSIRDMLSTLIKWTVMGFGVVIACNQLGIPIVAMLTGVSIIGLAVGFAAQETLANFIAGIVIFLDKPFKVADWILIDGEYGQVKRVTFRSTRLLSLEGEMIVFPNTQMLQHKVTNHSTNPINRITVPISIAYKESIEAARKAMLSVVKEDLRISSHPAPEVVVTACADSGVNLALRVWIADEAIEKHMVYELLERCKNALDAANIEIPFPQVDLHLAGDAMKAFSQSA